VSNYGLLVLLDLTTWRWKARWFTRITVCVALAVFFFWSSARWVVLVPTVVWVALAVCFTLASVRHTVRSFRTARNFLDSAR